MLLIRKSETQLQRLKNKPHMSIKDSQNLFAMFHHILSLKGPGPLGPVLKIWVVRSGPEGPQFATSVGTLPQCLN